MLACLVGVVAGVILLVGLLVIFGIDNSEGLGW